MSTCDFYSANSVTSNRTSWFGLLEFEKTIFVLVNLMDIVMTNTLLSTGSFYESNPIAEHVLQSWGMLGMVVFKLIVVAAVLMITNIIATRKVKTARRLLYAGVMIVGAVVTYSVGLLMFVA